MQVKVCDVKSNAFEQDLMDSVTNSGFAVLVNHDISHDLIKETQQQWRMFFLNSPEYKNTFLNKEDPNMGYKGFQSEKAVGAKVADLKEFFHYKPGKSLPGEVSGLNQLMFSNLESLGLDVLGVLDRNYDIPYPGFQDSCWDSDKTILRTLYYPALKTLVPEVGAVRAAAHEDINFITLLVAASAQGLQVLDKNGTWLDVPHQENSIVVNIGDMLQLSSGGMYKSTTHRVVNPDSANLDRISMPLFIHPNSDTVLAEGITAKQFLDKRLKEIYKNEKV